MMGDMISSAASSFVHYKTKGLARSEVEAKAERDRDSNSNSIRGTRATHVCAIFAFRSWESKCEVRFVENVN